MINILQQHLVDMDGQGFVSYLYTRVIQKSSTFSPYNLVGIKGRCMKFAMIIDCNLSYTCTINSFSVYLFAGAVITKHRFWTMKTFKNIPLLQYVRLPVRSLRHITIYFSWVKCLDLSDISLVDPTSCKNVKFGQ